MKTHVANTNIWWNPIDDLVIVPSFRVEWEDIGSRAQLQPHGTGVRGSTSDDHLPQMTEDRTTDQRDSSKSVTPDLGCRCSMPAASGARDGRGHASFSNGIDADLTGRADRYFGRHQQKYVVGANWYPMQGLSVSAQYYYQSYDQDFNHTDHTGLAPMPGGANNLGSI